MHWSILKGISQLIFPNICLNCDRSSEALFCQSCLERLFDPTVMIFKQQDLRIKVVSVLKYDHGVQKLIKSKFIDKPEMFVKICEIMALGVSATAEIINWNEFALCPVPCHWTKLMSRGFNQSEIISQELSRNLGLPQNKLIKKISSTDSQASTSRRSERFANVKSCFEVDHQAMVRGGVNSNSKIVLIDDLVTTGATLLQCARVIKDKVGCQEIIAMTISAKAL